MIVSGDDLASHAALRADRLIDALAKPILPAAGRRAVGADGRRRGAAAVAASDRRAADARPFPVVDQIGELRRRRRSPGAGDGLPRCRRAPAVAPRPDGRRQPVGRPVPHRKRRRRGRVVGADRPACGRVGTGDHRDHPASRRYDAAAAAPVAQDGRRHRARRLRHRLRLAQPAQTLSDQPDQDRSQFRGRHLRGRGGCRDPKG